LIERTGRQPIIATVKLTARGISNIQESPKRAAAFAAAAEKMWVKVSGLN
jgi:uncharacterized protein with GYD domain